LFTLSLEAPGIFIETAFALRAKPMKTAKLNAAQVWKEFKELLAPGLTFEVHDRAVYSHLFRHSRLEARGVLRLTQRSYHARYVVRLNLPSEVRAVRAAKNASAQSALVARYRADMENAHFLRYQNLRRSIHQRERGKCFYCLRGLTSHNRCLDHVIPQANLGGNSYRNLVSCCHDCNSKKKQRPAEELLRWLFRERRLSPAELRSRLSALCGLKAGKLVPQITQGK